LVYISAAKSIHVSSTTFTQSAQKSTEFGKTTLRLGLLRRSRSSKVTEFGTNRWLICDFLMAINSNLPPILHCFRDIASEKSTRNSSGDEIANVNSLYDDIVHVLQNTMLERMFTNFSEITQYNGHYAVQGHSRSPILVPIESSFFYTTSYL